MSLRGYSRRRSKARNRSPRSTKVRYAVDHFKAQAAILDQQLRQAEKTAEDLTDASIFAGAIDRVVVKDLNRILSKIVGARQILRSILRTYGRS